MKDIMMAAMACGAIACAVWYLRNRSGVQQWLDDLWDGVGVTELRKRFDALSASKKSYLMGSISDFLKGKIEERAYESQSPLFVRTFGRLAELGLNCLDDAQKQELVHAYADNELCDGTFDYDGACVMAAALWKTIPDVLAVRLCTADCDIRPVVTRVSEFVLKEAIHKAVEEGDGAKLLRIVETLPESVSEADILDCMRNAQDEANIVRCLMAKKDWDGAEQRVDKMQDAEEAARLLLEIRKGRQKAEPASTS